MLMCPAFVVFGVEGRLAGEHLVEEAAEGIQICPAVEFGGCGSVPLLGGGVGHARGPAPWTPGVRDVGDSWARYLRRQALGQTTEEEPSNFARSAYRSRCPVR